MVKKVNYTEKGMIRFQEKKIESENERVRQSICIDEMTWENISTKQIHYKSLFLIKDIHVILKQSLENPPMCTSLLKMRRNLCK